MLNCLCSSRFGLDWAHDDFYFARHMLMHFHAYVLYIQYISIYIWTIWSFSDCLFLPLSFFLFVLVVSVAPKRKSTPSQNPLRSGTSSSFDPTPFYVRFRDEDAQKDFSENFSQWSVHSECQVILANFANTDLSDVIHSRGWELLYDISVTCHSVLI